ncbi:MAG: hypothetical protein ACI31M_02700 [Bacilli bacterium]
MKEKIKLYYNLDVEDYKDNYFYLDGIYYQLVKWERTENEFKDILKICQELKQKQIIINEIILNVNNSYISDGFLLLKLNYFLDDEFSLQDILRFNNSLVITEPYKNNWLEMWKNKVDYLEYQVKELAHNKKTIIASFSYYIGLAENAISILNKINKGNTDSVLVLSRLRVKYPNYCNDYFNPINFIFDSRVRDMAEYLKCKFFAKEDITEDIELIINKNLTPYEYNLLFVRILYPSYYFDALENVLLNNKSEDIIVEIVKRVDDYQEMLRKVMIRLSQVTTLETLPWLMKKK